MWFLWVPKGQLEKPACPEFGFSLCRSNGPEKNLPPSLAAGFGEKNSEAGFFRSGKTRRRGARPEMKTTRPLGHGPPGGALGHRPGERGPRHPPLCGASVPELPELGRAIWGRSPNFHLLKKNLCYRGWAKSISHHFETMLKPLLVGTYRGIESFQAKFRPSTVFPPVGFEPML